MASSVVPPAGFDPAPPPLPGDGSFQAGDGRGEHDPVDPVPAALSATRTTEQRHEVASDTASASADLADDYPAVERLRQGLSEDRYEQEFAAGLEALLARIAEATGR